MMIRCLGAVALLLVVPAAVQSAELTIQFVGTVQSVVDANSLGDPIDFPAIPVGSSMAARDSTGMPTWRRRAAG